MSESALPQTEQPVAGSSDPLRRLRLTILSTIFGLLLFALWYDYRVARPAVDKAYDSITSLNFRINRASLNQAMTARDVQSVIGRAPKVSYSEGPYQIEIYAWVAGLPFRSHEYYAVYVGRGPNMVFMRHYKHYLPVEELTPAQRRGSRGNVADASDSVRHFELNSFSGRRENSGKRKF